MTRIPVHTIEDAPERSTDDLKKLRERFGDELNIFGAMGHSPAMLKYFIAAEETLVAESSLDPKMREAIHLTVSAVNDCDYCQSAYTMGAKAAGWTEDETVAIRKGEIDDTKVMPLLQLVREMTRNQGHVKDATWTAAIDAGWTEEELLEAFADAQRAIMTNYFNHFVETDLDVPAAPGLAS